MTAPGGIQQGTLVVSTNVAARNWHPVNLKLTALAAMGNFALDRLQLWIDRGKHHVLHQKFVTASHMARHPQTCQVVIHHPGSKAGLAGIVVAGLIAN